MIWALECISKMGPILYILVALPCTVGQSHIIHIYRHLLNYTEPTFQRYIARIIYMVPLVKLNQSGKTFQEKYHGEEVRTPSEQTMPSSFYYNAYMQL